MSKTLQDWLNWQETLHPSEIDLGLERVRQVLETLLPVPFAVKRDDAHGLPRQPFTVITIAGTNGKGSTVAMLEAILTEAGYRVGSYTSPHLIYYNERIKINRNPVSEQSLCQAFERIDQARGTISLTYFEFGTLAAIDLFHANKCEIVLLEVGLGGRLDAVNVIDADIALISTVDLDHQDWLGKDRNSIALEKAGIYRSNKPAIYGDVNLPESLQKKVTQLGLEFYQFSQDYRFEQREAQWDWLPLSGSPNKSKNRKPRFNLPLPQLQGAVQLKNAANVMMVLDLLKETFPVSQAEIKRGLLNTVLTGRFQVVSADPLIILDVAHNVQAAQNLRYSVEQLGVPGKVHVIVGMLKDKDVSDVLAEMEPLVDSWRFIDLKSPRAMPAREIEQILHQRSEVSKVSVKHTQCFTDFKQAYEDFTGYNRKAATMETLLVFGSFFTVSDALHSLQLDLGNVQTS